MATRVGEGQTPSFTDKIIRGYNKIKKDGANYYGACLATNITLDDFSKTGTVDRYTDSIHTQVT